MRFAKGHKAETRKRIIKAASARFRKDGVEAVGIAGLMAEAGLTHGGFYAHFDSKEDLLREAMAAAMEETGERLQRATDVEGLVRRYLRPSHRDMPENGCAIAALVAEIARHEPATRDVFSARVERFLARIAAHLTALPEPAREQAAIGILGVMLGTLQLSRAVTDKTLSDSVLESGIQAALRLAKPAQ